MGPILLPGGDLAVPPAFTSTSNDAIVSTSGWFTGHEAGATCPAGAADCSFAQVVATSAANTAISGASLLVDGVPVACSPTGVTAGGLTCQAELTAPQSYTWSLAFAADGVYQLAFSASSTNGAIATFIRQVKVDLHNPQLTVPAPLVVDEGGTVALQAQAADAAGGVVDIDWDLDNDGIFETTDETACLLRGRPGRPGQPDRGRARHRPGRPLGDGDGYGRRGQRRTVS